MISRILQFLHKRVVSIFMLIATAFVLIQIVLSTLFDTMVGLWLIALVWLALRIPRPAAKGKQANE